MTPTVTSESVPQFLYQFLPGPRPELFHDASAWTDGDEAVAFDHFNYLKQAAEDGVVLLAGRSQDGIGPAIVILETTSQEDAEQFMNADPFVSSGLFKSSIHPFRVALGLES